MGNSCATAPTAVAVIPRQQPNSQEAGTTVSGTGGGMQKVLSLSGTAAAELSTGRRMRTVQVAKAQVAYPTGDPSFAVMQPFPAGIRAEDADPFLMCDEFGPKASEGPKPPGGWHGHLGMDIMTYLVKGKGAHADSLGNQVVFDSPGFQWMSVGSGIEHAEGGAAPKGEIGHGFQIWINVPKERKLDDPRYGTEVPESIPSWNFDGGLARLLAGEAEGKTGPFATTQPVLMADIELDAGTAMTHNIPLPLDNCMVYVYRGSGQVAGTEVSSRQVVRLDAADPDLRELHLQSGPEGIAALIFAGKRIQEPIAWHGPFVMNTQGELRKAFKEYQMGVFPPKRAAWDYRRAKWNPTTPAAPLLKAAA